MGQNPESSSDPPNDDEELASSDDSFQSESDEEEALQQEIAEIPFEDLHKAKAEGRPTIGHAKKVTQMQRLNKNRPLEITSKKPVGRYREVIQAPKKVNRDPRFEDLCGRFDEASFKKSYNFLYEEQLPAEKERLQELLRKAKFPEAKEKIKSEMMWIDNQLNSERLRKKRAAKSLELRAKVKDAVKQGKKPYYPKKSEMKKQELVEKYNELKDSGKLEPFLAKRRHKNASKDHRYVPYRRQGS